MMKVINLFGGPGSGKSTLAAGLFERMKIQGLSVELVTEYAKDMVWERRGNILDDQLYILAKQHRRLLRLQGEMDYAITDSPLLLGLIYAKPNYYSTFEPLLLDIWNSVDNRNIFMMRPRSHEYQVAGRTQGVEEANRIDDKIQTCLKKHDIPFDSFQTCPGIAQTISQFLFGLQ
jgi:nicotinamide riboside kinase